MTDHHEVRAPWDHRTSFLQLMDTLQDAPSPFPLETSEARIFLKLYPANIQITATLTLIPRPSRSQPWSLRLRLTSCHIPTMRHPQARPDSIVLSSSSASTICDGLLKMTHCLMVELPAAELMAVCHTVETLLVKADQMLDIADQDLSLNFEGLSIDPSES